MQINENENIQNTGQGEAHHRMYKRLKLGGHVYYRTSVKIAVVT
jgi:hypothetical protein